MAVVVVVFPVTFVDRLVEVLFPDSLPDRLEGRLTLVSWLSDVLVRAVCDLVLAIVVLFAGLPERCAVLQVV